MGESEKADVKAEAPPEGAAWAGAPYGATPPDDKPKEPALAERPANMPTLEQVKEAMKDIYDPELFISLVELGLIYDTEYLPGDRVRLRMTLTSPACPLGETIQGQVLTRLTSSFPDVKNVEIEWVWWPRWDPRTMASEEAKMLLGIF